MDARRASGCRALSGDVTEDVSSIASTGDAVVRGLVVALSEIKIDSDPDVPVPVDPDVPVDTIASIVSVGSSLKMRSVWKGEQGTSRCSSWNTTSELLCLQQIAFHSRNVTPSNKQGFRAAAEGALLPVSPSGCAGGTSRVPAAEDGVQLVVVTAGGLKLSATACASCNCGNSLVIRSDSAPRQVGKAATVRNLTFAATGTLAALLAAAAALAATGSKAAVGTAT